MRSSSSLMRKPIATSTSLRMTNVPTNANTTDQHGQRLDPELRRGLPKRRAVGAPAALIALEAKRPVASAPQMPPIP